MKARHSVLSEISQRTYWHFRSQKRWPPAVPTAKGLVFFRVTDLLYFEVDSKESILYYWEQERQKNKVTIFKGITALKPKLEQYGFLMVRRDVLINTFHIQSISTVKTITMTDGKIIHPSLRKLRQVEAYIKEHFCI